MLKINHQKRFVRTVPFCKMIESDINLLYTTKLFNRSELFSDASAYMQVLLSLNFHHKLTNFKMKAIVSLRKHFC